MFHVKHRKNAALKGVWSGSRGGLNRSNAPLNRASGGLVGICFVAAGLLLAACSPSEEVARDAGVAKSAATAPTKAMASCMALSWLTANRGLASRTCSRARLASCRTAASLRSSTPATAA